MESKTNGTSNSASDQDAILGRLMRKSERRRQFIAELSDTVTDLEDKLEAEYRLEKDLRVTLSKANKEAERLAGRRNHYAGLFRAAEADLQSTSEELCELREQLQGTPRWVLKFFGFVRRCRTAYAAARQALTA